ncbi:hypothetical protein BDV36DRAFT_296293 [Aspergillus pseudocaelatus]|uniref:Uncharacterized protein n=1 Tax=Aspergillus pseudocaelatus TaxID=1825620 RepID=A0ABQ6WJF2_9EURO|nr:hypothetical protein BDV36DRAFT_296293 [Aspergillus pseudocaelatus]
MLAEVRCYIELLQATSFHDFSTEDRSKALLAFKKVSQMVIRNLQILVSTNNNVGDGMIASNFGVNAQGITVIRDEDTKECETNAWVPLTKLLHRDRVCGVISCSDEKQLKPTVISLQNEVRYNEFAEQISLSHPSRLMRMKHPAIRLTEQFRYRPVCIRFVAKLENVWADVAKP